MPWTSSGGVEAAHGGEIGFLAYFKKRKGKTMHNLFFFGITMHNLRLTEMDMSGEMTCVAIWSHIHRAALTLAHLEIQKRNPTKIHH